MVKYTHNSLSNSMIKECQLCQKSFNAPVSKAKFCSKSCYHQSNLGKPTWNAGLVGVMKPNKTSFKKGHSAGIRFGRDKDTSGANNVRWNGGVQRSHGYRKILIPEHPYATKAGYVREHRLVVEAILGRHLLPEENIHHINGIKDDNRAENLYLCSSNSEHQKIEHRKNKRKMKSNLL